MASSRDTRNGPDLKDLIVGMNAFEQINTVSLALGVSLVTEKGDAALEFRLTAFDKSVESSEAKPLASVKLIAGYSDPRTMGALILQLMYKVDAALATQAFTEAMRKEGTSPPH